MALELRLRSQTTHEKPAKQQKVEKENQNRSYSRTPKSQHLRYAECTKTKNEFFFHNPRKKKHPI